MIGTLIPVVDTSFLSFPAPEKFPGSDGDGGADPAFHEMLGGVFVFGVKSLEDLVDGVHGSRCASGDFKALRGRWFV